MSGDFGPRTEVSVAEAAMRRASLLPPASLAWHEATRGSAALGEAATEGFACLKKIELQA